MNMNVEELLKTVLDSFSEFDYIRTGDIPTIDLYMDQVTTFMDSKLKNSTRNPEEDKILTKTMINNYAKSDLLPPPVRKKYTKEHLLVMIFIYYFKSVMSIGDIEVILNPITERYFGKSGMAMKDIYSEILKLEMPQLAGLQEDLQQKCEMAQNSFQDAAQNHYETFGYASPMLFFGVEYWQQTQPVYPLLQHLVSTERYRNLQLMLTDSEQEIEEAVLRFALQKE